MNIVPLKVGEMGTNCYLAIDDETQETLIIDPGEEGDFITTSILENRAKPVGILLTHGHYDHCLAALDLKLNFNIPIYLHPKDQFLYERAHLSAKHFSGITIPKLLPVDIALSDGQKINFGNSALNVIHTPGHTPGSCCFLYQYHFKFQSESVKNNLFTGDTLFASGPGKADHSYSSLPLLRKTISGLKKNYPHALIYPGHEDTTFMI